MFGAGVAFSVYFMSATASLSLSRLSFGATFGITIQTLQLITVFNKFNFKYGEPIDSLISALDILSFDLELLNLGCHLGNSPILYAILSFFTPVLVMGMLFHLFQWPRLVHKR